MDAIVHAASATREPWRGRAVDVRGTRRLLAMAHEANIRHFLYVSIVGIDGVGYPYYRTKLAAEAEVRKDIVPWSILRATQFHDFVELLLRGFARMRGLIAVPYAWQLQPVDVNEVARRVVDVVLGEPGGLLPDFGGPEIRDMKSLAQSWLSMRKDERRMIDLRLPLKFSRQIAEGHLTSPEHKDGHVTFEQHLAQKYAL